PPHEFAINPPAALAAVREVTYDRYVPKLRGVTLRVFGTALVGVAVAVLLAIVDGVVRGGSAIWGTHRSAYAVIPYGPLLTIAIAPVVFGIVVTIIAAVRYWHDTAGPLRRLLAPSAVLRALRYAAELRYLR